MEEIKLSWTYNEFSIRIKVSGFKKSIRLSLECIEFLFSKSASISIDLKVLFDICESISKVLILSIYNHFFIPIVLKKIGYYLFIPVK